MSGDAAGGAGTTGDVGTARDAGAGASGFFVVLTGGIGGAKLCLGMQRVLPAGALRIVVNTGDDFEHLGLRISPDIDTTIYTLSGLSNTELGWGRRDETWSFMRALASIGGETWFQLGDGDLALHVERTRRLAGGESLSSITSDIARRLGVQAAVFPMCDTPVSTIVTTTEGELGCQDYFVRRRCAPVVTGLNFRGAESVLCWTRGTLRSGRVLMFRCNCATRSW